MQKLKEPQKLKAETIEIEIMEFTNWDIIITLIIAVYGAILSTYSIWSERQEHKREIKVRLSYGFIRNVLGQVSPTMIILEALNKGSKTVTLSSMGLILPKKKYLFLARPNSYVTFPHDLLDGKNVNVWLETKELAGDLKNEGYSGRIRLRGYYNDAIGNRYISKSVKFNIDKP